GMNDRWRAAGSGVAPAGPVRFRWEWRTARLARVLVDRIRGTHAASPEAKAATAATATPTVAPIAGALPPALARAWRIGGTSLQFDPGGRLVVGGREVPLAANADRLSLQMPDGEFEAEWHVESDRLYLTRDARVVAALTALKKKEPPPNPMVE